MRSSPEQDVSWEDALREVIRKYRAGAVGAPPDWVAGVGLTAERSNVACGDQVSLYRSSGGEVWVAAKGCSICLASAELLNRIAAGVSPDLLPGIATAIVAALDDRSDAGATAEVDPVRRLWEMIPAASGVTAALPPPGAPGSTGVTAADVAAFLPLRNVPGRRRCATLPWELFLDPSTLDVTTD